MVAAGMEIVASYTTVKNYDLLYSPEIEIAGRGVSSDFFSIL
jgi:hypothetical protein